MSEIKERFREENHIVCNTEILLEYLKKNLSRENGIKYMGYKTIIRFIQFPLSEYNNQLFCINDEHSVWLKRDEYENWEKIFKYVDLNDVEQIKIGYVSGLQNPYNNKAGMQAAHSGDYYEVYIQLLSPIHKRKDESF